MLRAHARFGAVVWLPAAGALSHLATVVLVFPHGYTDRLILPFYPLLVPYAAYAVEPLPRTLAPVVTGLRTVPRMAAVWIHRHLRPLVLPRVRERRNWTYLAYTAAVVYWLQGLELLTAVLLPVTATALAAVAGGCTMVAILLPVFPGFETSFPDLDLATLARSIAALAQQLGLPGGLGLFAVWIQGIVAGGARQTGPGRMTAAARVDARFCWRRSRCYLGWWKRRPVRASAFLRLHGRSNRAQSNGGLTASLDLPSANAGPAPRGGQVQAAGGARRAGRRAWTRPSTAPHSLADGGRE